MVIVAMNILQRIRNYQIRNRVYKKPISLVVEPTNCCNLNCPFCLVGTQNIREKTDHNQMERPFGEMDFSLFQHICDQAKAFGIERMQLHFQGEPFVHPRIIDMLAFSKNRGFYVQIFTNGLAFRDNMIDRLAQTGIDMIRFSIDGATEETYGKNRVGGNLRKVLRNMEAVARSCKKTTVEWQFIAMKNNEHEIPLAKEMARKLKVHFFVKTFAPTIPELIPKNPQYIRQYKPKPCKDIYFQTCIYWNGDVVPCCYDVEGSQIMGNVGLSTLKEIWESEKYRAFREKVDRVDDKDIKICQDCLRWK